MPRSGMGRIFQRGNVWWLDYGFRGKRHRESSGSAKKGDATKLLKKRLAEMGSGTLIGPDAERVTLKDLKELIRTNYRLKGNRSVSRLERSLAHLTNFFGAEARALDITSARVKAYEVARLDSGASRSTVNAELASLRRMFTIAIEEGELPASARPKIRTPEPKNARTGFFERDDFDLVLAELPQPLQPFFEFAYYTGWRTYSEIAPLTWDRVDVNVGTVRLDPNTTKNDEGRVFPVNALPALKALLERQREHTRAVERRIRRLIPWVFHRDGRRIKSYDDAWRTACRRAATEKRKGKDVIVRPYLLDSIPHDLRRTAVRNLVRAGVPERVAMQLTGHKTRSVFDRYDIVNEADLSEGVAKLARSIA